jgi:PAS domain S-box-containing protein
MTNHYIKELLHDSSALNAIIGCIGDAVSIQDADWKVLFQNDAHKKLYGDHVGDYCYKGFHQQNNVCGGCPVVIAVRDGCARSITKSCITDKGVIYTETTASPIRNMEGTTVASIGVTRNITDRIQTDGSISATKQMLEDVTQGITESILLLSTDYKILWANKAALQQTGLEANELVGNYCYKATHDSDSHCEPPNNPCPVHELLISGEPRIAEHEHHDKDGNKIYAEVSAYPIKDSTGKIIRFVHLSKDITERKNLERERVKLIRELQDALAEIRTLKGIIPICSFCKNIRNDSGYWEQIETYISQHSEAEFTHGICPQCAKKIYPAYLTDKE